MIENIRDNLRDFGVAVSILLNGICCGLFDKVSEDIQDRVDYAFIIICTDIVNGNHACFNVRLYGFCLYDLSNQAS